MAITKKLQPEPHFTQPVITDDVAKVFNDPGAKITGAKGDFVNKFNDPKITIPKQSYQGISFEEYGAGGWQNMTPEQRRTWEAGSGYNPTRSPAQTQQFNAQVPEVIAPESSLEGIRSVFGQDFTPALAFTPELQKQGIFGAVRVGESPDVFTLGFGGTKETPESFQQKFGTLEQEGIVGEPITKEQAIALGIRPSSITPSGGITPESLETKKVTEIPEGEVGIDGAGIISASAEADQKAIQERIALFAGEGTETKEKADTLTDEIIAGLTKLEGEGASQLAEEEARGIPAIRESLTTINNQITTKLAEFNKVQADLDAYSKQIAAQPLSTGYIAGLQSKINDKLITEKNSMAADVGILQAQGLAIQGRLADAQNAANRAIDVKYDAIEQRLKTQSFLLEILEGTLTKEEQTRADAINSLLNEEKERLNEKKDVDKQIQGIMITAANNNAPSEALAQITAAETVLEATQIASQYLPEAEIGTQVVEANGRKLLVNTQTGETIRDLGVADVGGAGISTAIIEVGGQKVLINSKTGATIRVLGEAPTDIKPAQRLAAGFATRIEQSGSVIDRLGKDFTGVFSRFPTLEGFKSEDRKLLEQAERNFVNAVLRRESGAAISPEEFVSAEKQYFPQRGDGEAVLNQKAENRTTILESMKLEAGAAFGELAGELPPAINQGITINGVNYQVGEIIENEKGQKGRIESDGTITIIE